MSEGDLQRLEELLAEALELRSEDRASFLDHACGDDPDLRRELEELLAVHDDAAGFFEKLSGDIAATAGLELESAARPRLQIGSYRTLEAVGQGGMGAVYRAERIDGAFDQEVALKLLHRDMDSPQLRARFLAERQILAQLSHPNIARLMDGGVTDEGRPFFAMEYVNGLPITRYCEQHALGINQILRLFLDVIDAVSYLHRNLVVHRDLKPSNILVDRDGQVKLLDFGIAKLLAESGDEAGMTRTGERLMTPEYAAPEQLLGAPVTTATDVYALGIVLYELLTGRRPHWHAATEGRPGSRDLPPTPSSLLRSRRRGRGAAAEGQQEGGSEAGVVRHRIPGDLDTICLAALRPEPEARYPSADQLGQDIERHLCGLPVRARKSTLGYRMGKFVRRHRVGVAATAGLLLLAAAGFVRERSLRAEAEVAQGQAQKQAARAEAVSLFLRQLLSSVDPAKAQGQEVTVADVLEQAALRIEESTQIEEQPAVEAALRRTIGSTYMGLGKYPEAREHLERALEIRGGIESGDPEALVDARGLGTLYGRLGLFEEAEPILRGVIEAQVEALGKDDPVVLNTMNELADLLWRLGRHDEVEAIDRQTLEIRRRVLGEDHPDTLKSLNGLAATLFTAGRYAEAADFFDQALDVARATIGENHPHTLTLANNLAAAYLELGQNRNAESILRDVVEARTRVLGAEHHETAMSVHNLGAALAQQARYVEAAEQLRLAIAIRESFAGEKSSELGSRSLLADVLREQGHHQDAAALYLSTLEQQQELYGSEDPSALKTLASLAELRLRQGDPDAAEGLLDQAQHSLVQVHGEGHPDTLGSLTTRARILIAQERFAEALELSDAALEAGVRALGANHPVVLTVAFEKARALQGLSRHQEAQELAARIHENRAVLLGEEHPDTFEARVLLDGLRRESDGRTGE